MIQSLLETRDQWLRRKGLRRMPEGVELVRSWNGSLVDISLCPYFDIDKPLPKDHWSSTRFAHEIEQKGPVEAQRFLDHLRECFKAAQMFGPRDDMRPILRSVTNSRTFEEEARFYKQAGPYITSTLTAVSRARVRVSMASARSTSWKLC